MRRPFSTASAAALLMAMAISLPVAAGGWATMIPDADAPPSDGGSTLISFTLLQHGMTPVDFGEATVVATNVDDGSVVRAQASPQPGSDGRWTARLSVPAGTWTYVVTHTDLEIQAPDALTFTVDPAAIGGASAAGSTSNGALALGLAGTVAAIWLLAIGFLLLYRRQRASVVRPR